MITNKHFIDWEASVFGFGYGSGEPHTLAALKSFLELCARRDGPNGVFAYDYQQMEGSLGHTVAWLMINILAHADVIEYGSSPRYGWLTQQGEMLKEFISERTVDQLYDLTSVDHENYVHCAPEYCNCDTPCANPLFDLRFQRLINATAKE